MTKRYQRDKQKSYIRGQTIQWPRDTKEVNRNEFCLPLWYLLVIVLSVLWFTSSVYLFGISWSLYCLSSDIRLLFISLVSLGHCIVCPLIYDFCLPLWYLLVIVTIQWPRYTKEVNRSRISEDRQYNDQEIPKRQTEVVYQRTYNIMTKKYQRGKQKS
jgi:hypothetical protein